ncbi:MAG: LCP family protein [Oscillospiraceae bacterium]|nr:LCP family protein [Oscillospiraceae bacterium]
MNRKPNPNRSGFIILAILAVICMVGATVYFLNGRQGRATDPAAVPEDDSPTLLYNGGHYRLNENVEAVLIMGVDKNEGYDDLEAGSVNHQQADFLMLLVLDRDRGVCTPLHINRDTMCVLWQLDIYGEPLSPFNGQITLAHAYGSGGKDSCRNQVRAVSDLLYGTKIDHYFSVTMDAVPIINDMAGGVTVTVLDDFSAVDSTLVQGEKVTLQGDQALTYVRGRMNVGDTTNLSRMARQRQYVTALRQQVLKQMERSEDFVLKMLSNVSASMVSDCSVYQLSDLADALTTYEFADIQTIAGESVVGEEFMEYYADEDALYQQVIDLFYVPVEE